MKYVNLGNSGLKVSQICMGCMSFGSSKWQPWVLEEAESLPLLKRAYELGINFFDTANAYSNGESERILGKFVKENNIPRDEIVIATKACFPVDKTGQHRLLLSDTSLYDPNRLGLSRKNLIHSVNDSLERKVRYIGASSMYAWQFAKAQHIAEKNGWTKFISLQNLYNTLYREEERDMIPLCIDQGVGITPWSPLFVGVLANAHQITEVNSFNGVSNRSNTDVFKKAFTALLNESDLEIVKRVSELSKKKNCEPAQLAIAWLFHKPFY